MTVPVAGRGPELLAVYGLFVALTTLTVSLRTYCRAVMGNNSFGWDDGLALVAWVFFVILASLAIAGIHHGTGQHVWDIKPASEIPVALKFWWLCEPVFVISNMAVKASIAVMLLRLMVKPIHRYIIWAVLIPTQLSSTAFFFLFIFQCQPSSYFWTQYTGGSGHCINPTITIIFAYAYSALTCVGDWVFAILPWVLVWDLQMPKTQKLFVGAVLTMGAIASAATIARIPYISTLNNHEDFLFATTNVALWSCCETGLGITACSCATLRPLFRTLWNPLSHRSSGRLPDDKGSARTHGPRQYDERYGHTSNAFHKEPHHQGDYATGKSDTWTVQYELDDTRQSRPTGKGGVQMQRTSSEQRLHESPAGSLHRGAVGAYEFPDPYCFRTKS